TFFALLAVAAYVRWTRRPSSRRYLLVLIAFVLALAAKSMVVTLPFVLLLLDYWPLGRRRAGCSLARLIVEKTPLFALAAAASVLTIAAQGSAGAIRSLRDLTITDRLANATVSYAAYLGHTVWPVDLTIFSPSPASPTPGRVAGAAVLVLALS